MGRVAFGGPDLPYRALRDLLAAEIAAVPPGGFIDWSTYYFRDRALAACLIAAGERGVRVRVVMERRPRLERANSAVIAMLAASPAVELVARRWWPGRLHAKIYAFSHPDRAWVGSFNPSGDTPEDAQVVNIIGNQDRGDNILMEIVNLSIVEGLRRVVTAFGTVSPLLARLDPRLPAALAVPGLQISLYPRWQTTVIENRLACLRAGDRVIGAISHLKDGPLTSSLRRAAKSGAEVQLVTHATERRVPEAVVAGLISAGVRIHRGGSAAAAPMHAKMLLVTENGRTVAWTGSYNYNPRSQYLNAEILISSDDEALVAAIRERLGQIMARSEESVAPSPSPH
ncbi:phospholipase D-like domain-containing protein [Pacificimonas sp. ICDLI1SI03]